MLGTIKEDRLHIRNLNFRLIFYVLVLSVLGVLVVNSATANEISTSIVNTTVKQIIGIGGGVIVMAVLTALDYHKLVKYSWVFYLIAIAGLIYVRFFCAAIYGAHRWIYIPFFGTIQPSEFSKPALLLLLTFALQRMGKDLDRAYMLLLFFALSMPVLVLVLIEPDLSTSIVIVVLILSTLFLGGISYRWIMVAMVILIPLIVIFMVAVYEPDQAILHTMLKDHQVDRINGFFFPENYPEVVRQQNNSVMAIGSGGLFGKGLKNSSLESVKNGHFLSEESCDFIFAVVGEELGLVGSLFTVLMIGLIVFECFFTAKKCTDNIGKVIAGSCGTILGVQSFINIGVSLLLLPNTGIPLPFVSAGLSSLLSSYILIGLVLSVSMWGRVKRRIFY